MLEKNNKEKVLEVFFDNPVAEMLQLREVSRIVNIAPKSVKMYLDILQKENLVLQKNHKGSPVYYANRDNDYFKYLKKIDMLRRIKETGLLDYIDSICPETIVLFGSASRGEDTNESDIDIFVETSEKELDLTGYEKKLKRKINLFFGEFNNLSRELKMNIINGDVLKGYLKVDI